MFDLLLALAVAMILAVPALLIAVAARLTTRGPTLYRSNRLGRHPPAMSMGSQR